MFAATVLVGCDPYSDETGQKEVSQSFVVPPTCADFPNRCTSSDAAWPGNPGSLEQWLALPCADACQRLIALGASDDVYVDNVAAAAGVAPNSIVSCTPATKDAAGDYTVSCTYRYEFLSTKSGSGATAVPDGEP